MLSLDQLTVVLPAKNELNGLKTLLPKLRLLPCRVIVVDDGSGDGTAQYVSSLGFKVISHRESKGNGAAVKTGIEAVETRYVGLMDADGQHSVDDLLALYEVILEAEADLVVGSRAISGQASWIRWLANSFYNRFASWMVSKKVEDLTSGQRIFVSEKIKKIVWMLPDSFSYPTTSTMVFYRLGYDVIFHPVSVARRVGRSHIRMFRDGFRFLLIIMKIGTLYSPFKLFVPISFLFFMLGLGRYLYTYLEYGVFTNMSALLFVSSIMVFLMGVLSEQVALAIISKIK